jgi:hypothetical protein
MTISRLTAIYTAIGLAALLAGLVVVLLLRSSPVVDSLRRTYDAARATQNHRVAPAPGYTGNQSASNANALRGLQGGPPTASPTSIVYPTLAPVKPLSQTIGGYTVTLYPVYADANRIGLTYTMQSSQPLPDKLSMCEPLPGEVPIPLCSGYPTARPAGTSPSPVLTRKVSTHQLSGANGSIYPWVPGPIWRDEQLASPTGFPLVFDSQLSSGELPAELKLHLTMNTASILVPPEKGFPATREIRGPFTFDFTMPVDPVRRIAELNQTLTANPVHKVTITRVIATRHHVRISWRWEYSTWSEPTGAPGTRARAPYGLYACCWLHLEVGGKPTYFYTSQGPPVSGSAVADVPALHEQGEWTIAVSHYSTWTGGRMDPPLSGPEFRFMMPPAVTSLQP